MAILKRILKGALAVLLALVAVLWAFKAYRDAHYFDNYDPRAPLNITLAETTEVNKEMPGKSYTITRFTFDGYRGEQVPSLLSRPTIGRGKRIPAVIFLHGIGQNKNFLKEITAPFNQVGFALACFDQYRSEEHT